MNLEYNSDKTKFKNPQTGKWVDATKKYGKELLAQYNKGKIPPKRKSYIKKKINSNTLETNNLQSNVFNNHIDEIKDTTANKKNIPPPIEIKVIHEHVQTNNKEFVSQKIKTPPIPPPVASLGRSVIENKFFPECRRDTLSSSTEGERGGDSESESSDEEIEQQDNKRKLFNNVSSFLNNVNIFNIKNQYSRFQITDITDSEDSGYITSSEDDN